MIAAVCTEDRISQLSAKNNPELICSLGISFSVFSSYSLLTSSAPDVNCGEGHIKMLKAIT